jgi:hypothetical protein
MLARHARRSTWRSRSKSAPTKGESRSAWKIAHLPDGAGPKKFRSAEQRCSASGSPRLLAMLNQFTITVESNETGGDSGGSAAAKICRDFRDDPVGRSLEDRSASAHPSSGHTASQTTR